MAVLTRCAAALMALMCAVPAWAQHVAPNPDTLAPVIKGASDVNKISIEPASALEPKPVTPVTVGELPDVGPDAQTEAYMDGLFAAQIAAGRVVGAAVVILRNGQVTFKKGYGVADLETRAPVDPDATLFRVASISKPVAAILAMQQVEAGKLDLNSDVNAYLPSFKLAAFGPQPVTLAHLLSHTGGFDDRYLGMNAKWDAPVEPLGAHLARRMPARIRPAGLLLDYSNYGYGLAGHVTELAAGVEFRALAKAQIFDKWGMTQSSFGIANGALPRMATPYVRTPKGLLKISHSAVVMAPAGDMVTTAGDMGRLMAALMAGAPDVLKPETLSQMLQPQFTPGRGPDAWGLGFAIGRMNGVTWVGHGGDLPGYGAEFRFDPVSKSGFFVSLNVSNTFDVMQPLIVAIGDKVWPDPGDTPATINAKAAAEAAQRLAGVYVATRRARADFTLVGAGASALTLTPAEGGVIMASSSAVSTPLRFEPVADGLWQAPGVKWWLSAYDNPTIGEGVLLGPFAFERASFALNFAAHVPLLLIASAILGLVLVLWGAQYANRGLFGEPDAQIHLGARATAAAAAALSIVFVTVLMQSLSALDVAAILEGRAGALNFALVLPYAIAALTIPAIVFCVFGFGRGLRARLAQGVYALVVLLLIWVVWFAWTWNLHLLAY